ncbi:MAG: D-alanyl-D-alanine carboxypeptidase/D-alanyl-D-alanine-endopeptidase [Gemmatimonadetes bacterium]|nr:D-alanyl-D-alanine carboxypeptidase/D-alanyl-D-alanine-endopeptidase [Gemmatimonadota bacterium]
MKPTSTLRLAATLLSAACTALAGPPAGAFAQATLDSSALGRAIAAVTDAGALARAHWGIAVQDVASGDVIHARNAEQLFVPASNLKLVVAATAAHHLDPAYRYVTSFLADGEVRGGRLHGALVVRGSGDPTISGRYEPDRLAIFTGWADSLRAHGVRRIDRGLVADVGAWPAESQHGDWQKYDLNWWYAAPTGPLGFNDDCVDFRVAPGAAEGAPADITAQPESRAFTFANRTRTVAPGQSHTLDFERVPGTDSIYAFGDIPLGTAARTESFAVRDPAFYTATVLAETLVRAGIRVDARAVRQTREPVAGALPLFEYRSPPLPQVLGPILQNSQNWYAEQLLRTLGKEVQGEGSWAAGLAVEAAFLHDVVGIDTLAFRLRDASGLSTGNLVTPAALASLLRYIAATPGQQAVRDALPVGGGQTGSLRSRFTDLPGRVRAKTGSVRNVASLSGLVRTGSGRELAFSIIVNGTGLPAGQVTTAIDRVVRLLAAL